MHKNHVAVMQLKLLGYPLANIRKSLHKLTGLTRPDIARQIGCSRSRITLHVEGRRENPDVQSRIAEIYRVPAHIFLCYTLHVLHRIPFIPRLDLIAGVECLSKGGLH